MFLYLSVSHSDHEGGVCGMDVHGKGACVAGEHAWQGDVHGSGVCMAGGGMCGRRDDHWSGRILQECILGFLICNYYSVFL